MKVISLWQPWASLMAVGVKRNETRSWSTPYRGWLAIAATASIPRPVRDELLYDSHTNAFRQEVCTALKLNAQITNGELFSHLPLGQILCVVKLVDCKRTEAITVGYPEAAFGNYEPNRYAWVTTDCRRLPTPIQFKGSQGLRDLDPGIVGAIRRQVEL